MFRRASHRLGGFTLVELAIVLGIVGVLASGLWRLMATGTQQTKDVATAQQQLSLINAVKGYLADNTVAPSGIGGQSWLGAMPLGSAATLPIPAACPGAGGTQAAVFCTYLPPGFTSNTTNPYGQKYTIQVVAGITNAQQNYSFMIVASGGAKPVPDPDGGRISSLIGGDGGFIYTSAVCTAAPSTVAACGTMGGWKVLDVTAAPAASGYSFAAAATGSGSVASLSFISSALSNNLDWLARVQMPGDPTENFNTMQTPFYLGGGVAAGNTFFFGSYNPADVYFPATATTVMNVEGGVIDVGSAGKIKLEADPNGIGFQITGMPGGVSLGGGRISLSGDMTIPGAPATVPNPLLLVTDPCDQFQAGQPVPNFSLCGLAVSISGNVGISGMLDSNVFIYTGSDERLKKDIKPLNDDTLDNIMKLNPVSFVYKANNLSSLGFIAQDLEKVYPQMVTTGPSGMKQVAYDELIAPMTKSIQELKKENNDLRSALHDQSVKQEEMEQQIRTLQQKK